MNKGGTPENLLPPFYKSGRKPKNPGRKKSRIKQFIQDLELSSDEVTQLAKTVLQYNEEEIKQHAQDKAAPFILRLFCRYLVEDMQTGNAKNVLLLLDRAVGKPKEHIEINKRTEVIFSSEDEGLL